MAEVLDSLAVIFPFEVECYQDVDLPVSFVGHPFVSSEYKSPVHYDKQGSLLLLPGSRVQPIQRILPVFLDATEILVQSHSDLKIEVPVPQYSDKAMCGANHFEQTGVTGPNHHKRRTS